MTIIIPIKLPYQYLAAFSVMIGYGCTGLNMAWPSPSLPRLFNGTEIIQIDSNEGAWITVTEMISACFGSIIGAFLMDKIGRKATFVLTSLPLCTVWIIIGFANSVGLLYFARFIAGISDGILFTLAPIYMSEIANPKIRGCLGTLLPATWTIAMLFINFIGASFSITTTAFIMLIWPLVFFITSIWLPESPYYYLMKNENEKARDALQLLKGSEESIDVELKRLTEAVETQTKNKAQIYDLFINLDYRKSLLIVVLLRTAEEFTGFGAIISYTQIICKQTTTALSPDIATIIYMIVQLITVLFCSIIIDRIGRRPLLFISITGSAFSLFTLGIYFYLSIETNTDLTNIYWLPLFALYVFVVFFTSGMLPIPSFMQGEIFPTNVKAQAVSFSVIYLCILATIVTKLFQIINDLIGMYLPFFVFAAFSFINLIFMVVIIPETKGKTLEQIYDELKGKGLLNVKLLTKNKVYNNNQEEAGIKDEYAMNCNVIKPE